MKLPGWYWRAYHRSHNRLLDAWARLQGCCNADTWDPLRKNYAAGYSHWRCGKAHGHAGPHRYNNYIWWYRGESRFDPLPATPVLEREKAIQEAGLTHMRLASYRHGTMPRGRERAFHREMEIQRRIRADAARAVWGEDGDRLQDLID